MSSLSKHDWVNPSTPPGRPANLAALLTPGVWWRIAILVALMSLLYRQEFRRIGVKWINNPDWSHGFVIPIMSLVFVYLDRAKLVAARIRPNALGLVVLAAGIALYTASIWLKFGYPKSLSVVVAIVGVVLLLCGWDVLRVVWFPIVFLLFALPLPDRIYVQMTLPLRMLGSEVAANILSAALPSLEAVASGTIIEYVDANGRAQFLNVEQACAGMRLIMAFGALGVTMAYLAERPVWHRIVLVLTILPIAVVCNIIRVTLTGLFVIQGKPEWAQGRPHEMLGLAMLGVAFGLFSLVSYVLNHLVVEVAEAETPTDVPDDR